MPLDTAQTCPKCQGEGQHYDFRGILLERCELCHGTGDRPDEVWTLDLNYQGDHQYSYYRTWEECWAARIQNDTAPAAARGQSVIINPKGERIS